MDFAWVTLLTRATYIPGVLALHRSIQMVSSEFPLIVMITPAVDQTVVHFLRQRGCIVQEVAAIMPIQACSKHYAASHYSDVWTKLQVWDLTTYKRVCFLDADMVFLQNSDELATIDIPEEMIGACHTCRCNLQRRPLYPRTWIPENCVYTKNQENLTYSAAKDHEYFNAGLLLLRPDKIVYNSLITKIGQISDFSVFPFPEQDFLNSFYSKKWISLPHTYNSLKTLSISHPNLWDLNKIKVIHYILEKPWEQDAYNESNPYSSINKIWQIFSD